MTLPSTPTVLRGRAVLLALLVAVAGLLAVGRAQPAFAIPGTCSFAQASYTVVEGQQFSLTVNRSGGSDATNALYTSAGTGVDPAIPGTHYNPFAGSISVANGAGSGSVTISTLDDGITNPARTAQFTLQVGGAGDCTPAGQTTANLTITDNDSLAPTVTGIFPHSGPAAGGTTVTITGSNFLGATSVTFEGVPAGGFVVNNSTQITATSPVGVAGTIADIIVSNANGPSTDTAADDFAYSAGPTVTSVSPTGGPTAGGNAVTITGTGFTGASGVTFGGTAASFSVNNDSQITATAPAHAAGTVDVIVTVGVNSSPNTVDDNYTYSVTLPSISSLSPSSGPVAGGNSVTIFGSNFTGATSVMFGGVAASFIVNSSSSITATAPAVGFAQVVDVTVTTPSGTSSTAGSANDYTYTLLPNITFLSPNTGSSAGGNTVIITGTGFLGVTSVTFGGVSASFTVNSSTQITATAPAGAAGTVDVRATNSSGTSPNTAADDYTYTGGPTITSISPVTGPVTGGTTVTITGTGFTGATAVKFGTTNATTFTVLSSTTITAVSPAHTAGTVDVSVTTPAGTTANTAADDFTYGTVPSISSISPTSGPTSGGTVVTITGANLLGVTNVRFGTTEATTFTVNSSTSITVISPAHAAGTVDVSVTSAAGTSPNTTADNFTYTGGPAITSISPTSGSSAGGTTVTVNGVGFTGATSVTVGGKSASFTVNSDSKITLTTPSGTAGTTVDIRVTTPAGTSPNTAADNFTYSGGTFTYTLYLRWNLIVWMGQDGINADTAVQGGLPLVAGQVGAQATNVSTIVTSILRWNAPQQKWESFFPGTSGVPGANDFTTLQNGRSYWVAVKSTVDWTIPLP